MIPIAEPWITDEEIKRVLDAVERGWVSPQGEYVNEFENAFSDFVGVDHAIATSTGTSALHLSLLAAGVGPGDEVIVPDLTWIGTANAVRYVGATPIFADVNRETYTLDPTSMESIITKDTVAVLPVHLYGQPCHMSRILEISNDYGLFVIEDAAEAHGARYNGDAVGSIGDVGCFSFYGNKIFTTGQGGMITTNDDELAEKIRLYRRDGMSTEQKYYHTVVGYNYRLSNVQAAIGVGQVRRAEEILSEKHRVAQTYRDELTHSAVQFQSSPDRGESAHWMVAPVFETESQLKIVDQALTQEGIETRPFFYPLHKQPPYENSECECPNTLELTKRGMNLPSSPTLSEKQIRQIIDIIMKAL